jgi:hypothetical protein
MPLPQYTLMPLLINRQRASLFGLGCNSSYLPRCKATTAMFAKLKNAYRETTVAAFIEDGGR